jgi:hypothetical protein
MRPPRPPGTVTHAEPDPRPNEIQRWSRVVQRPARAGKRAGCCRSSPAGRPKTGGPAHAQWTEQFPTDQAGPGVVSS